MDFAHLDIYFVNGYFMAKYQQRCRVLDARISRRKKDSIESTGHGVVVLHGSKVSKNKVNKTIVFKGFVCVCVESPLNERVFLLVLLRCQNHLFHGRPHTHVTKCHVTIHSIE